MRESVLELQTRQYWQISKAFHGRVDFTTITTGDAITFLSDLTNEIYQQRPLWRYSERLLGEIIVGDISLECANSNEGGVA